MNIESVSSTISLALQAKEILALGCLIFLILYTYIKILPMILFYKDQRLAEVMAQVQVSLDKMTNAIDKLDDRLTNHGTKA